MLILSFPYVIVIIGAATGSAFTNMGLVDWYPNLNLPAWTPTGGIIGGVWITIYILTMVSVMLVRNVGMGEDGKRQSF
ncbi:MAG: hypothetical protein COU81_02350 [Candidatus Portnoybacteria bacterium CG10_big_fil_rev_8_21_14_0_10_36_7]|uniref:Uncharacterized protein n=1 Tax=Candidatus Portnoybacteria bacterium CG10_big_fil_rev_8_21_14_0_10_36_7 TaxID=1974812 RepID=A0A2M8KDW1_9BACT|nr:MAG: hypothetical protein COU81_02350 [Candidatus Portnoybacteria bacterium CG10_big_fil_rev_8_21_14_0_10_36_7]